MKKGRHRRFEEARALKRSQDIDIEGLFESLQSERPADAGGDHPEWADMADMAEAAEPADANQDDDDS
ncbi:MAG: hypothetical protein JJE52_05670 [Acidimicrobiia bacterium]|nr:hypothetical protein [Acidimicrobiia bacterium]